MSGRAETRDVRLALALLITSLGCGGAGASTSPPSVASVAAEVPVCILRQPTVLTCDFVRPGGFEFSLQLMGPVDVRLERQGDDHCVLMPAHGEPLEWIASFAITERHGAPVAEP